MNATSGSYSAYGAALEANGTSGELFWTQLTAGYAGSTFVGDANGPHSTNTRQDEEKFSGVSVDEDSFDDCDEEDFDEDEFDEEEEEDDDENSSVLCQSNDATFQLFQSGGDTLHAFYSSGEVIANGVSTAREESCGSRFHTHHQQLQGGYTAASNVYAAPPPSSSSAEMAQDILRLQNVSVYHHSSEHPNTHLSHMDKLHSIMPYSGGMPQQTTSDVDSLCSSYASSEPAVPNDTSDPLLRGNICPVCGKAYARPSTLKTHLRTHSGERPYKCAVCAKTFSQAANLTAHMRTHSGEKPFKCTVCQRRFSQSSSVTTHMRTHSGERPYRCSVCRKAFSDSSTLTKHQRVHSGEKPYRCPHCQATFSQSGNLNRHLRLHGNTSGSISGHQQSTSWQHPHTHHRRPSAR